MKKTRLLILSLLVLPAASLAFRQQSSKNVTPETAKLQVTQCALKVSGMSCGGCAASAKQALLKLDGVKAVTVDFKTASANVEYDSKRTSPEKIVAAFNQLGSGVRVEVSKPRTK